MKKSGKNRKRRDEKGIALIATLGLISMLSILSISLMGVSLVELQSAERYENRLVAFHEADGAIDQTIVNLRANRTYAGVPATNFTIGRTSGTYSTTVTQSQTNANVYTIASTGNVGANAQAYGFQARNITAIVEMASQGGGGFGIFSNGAIQMSGNATTDAYDSRLGPYSQSNKTNEGNIGTNTTRAGFVMLSGNARVNGDLAIGPGGNPLTATQISGNARITGTKYAASAATPMTAVSIPNNLPNSGALSVTDNNTVTLGAGTYYYSSISVSGNGRLNVTGAATVYVNGNVSISGNGVGTAQNLPPNLTINVAGARSVTVSGNGDFFGKIYAPQSSISVTGNGNIFGAISGSSFSDSGNGMIHYDKALGGGSSQSTNNELKAWTEVSY